MTFENPNFINKPALQPLFIFLEYLNFSRLPSLKDCICCIKLRTSTLYSNSYNINNFWNTNTFLLVQHYFLLANWNTHFILHNTTQPV